MVMVEHRGELVWQDHVLLHEVNARGSPALDRNFELVEVDVLQKRDHTCGDAVHGPSAIVHVDPAHGRQRRGRGLAIAVLG